MVTVYDIAKAVGVTKTTVANALAGKPNVSEATRQRILQCAQEMGYRPNLLARSFSQRKTFTISLILPSISHPFYPEVAEAIQIYASGSEYQTILCNTRSNYVLGKQQMERLVSRWVDGCVVMEESMDIADLVQYFQQGLPLVLCDWQEHEPPPDIPQVRGDYFRAGVLAAEHVLDLGHRHVAVIVDEPGQILRLQGFCTCLQQAGITVPREMILHGDSSVQSGYAAVQTLLTAPVLPTAIFATTDLMAIGALNALLDAGLRVPQDISLIGLDDITISSHIRPSLTTIGFPKEQLAKEVVELLFAQIHESREITHLRLIEPYLVVRQSTTGPRSE
ncbi:MAG: LacI family DNA-binding transcriptional regulator [Ktedonobacteraceae bacterium]|nr:LacI family DNA-binding transcriptional regulator [Ktedonobacteraceae bacterium]